MLLTSILSSPNKALTAARLIAVPFLHRIGGITDSNKPK